MRQTYISIKYEEKISRKILGFNEGKEFSSAFAGFPKITVGKISFD